MHCYFQAMKKNIFLCLMTIMVLFLTSGFWYGIPLFGLIEVLSEAGIPGYGQLVLISFSVGFCFSVFCIPFHLSYAKEYARNKAKSMTSTFFKAQGILITIVAFLFFLFYLIVSLSVL